MPQFTYTRKIHLGLSRIAADAFNAVLSSLPADWPHIAYEVYQTLASEAATVAGANYASILPVLQAPQSRGNLTIASANMSDAPLINPNLFTGQSDVDIMVASFKRTRQALGSAAMAPVLIGPEIIPGPSVQTDAQILAYLKQAVNPFSHATSTCKMGQASDANAVVDPHGKVYGIKNCETPLPLGPVESLDRLTASL